MPAVAVDDVVYNEFPGVESLLGFAVLASLHVQWEYSRQKGKEYNS